MKSPIHARNQMLQMTQFSHLRKRDVEQITSISEETRYYDKGFEKIYDFATVKGALSTGPLENRGREVVLLTSVCSEDRL